MTSSHQELNALLSQANVSKIVYSLVMPETEAVVDRVLDGTGHSVEQGRQGFHDLFREAWTQKQDAAHERFFQTWTQWSSPIVRFEPSEFPFTYPICGASEGIREAIHSYGVRGRRESFVPRIHVFAGEYEGFAAYAAAAGIVVVTHDRCRWDRAIESLGPHDQFCLSQPSAIDGMIWPDYDLFVTEMGERVPEAELMLDLTYVGCVSREFDVRADYPNVAVIFFSLSKPAGAYYHRIGGMFSRKEYAGLFGNKWFKNLTSLSIGTEFMSQCGVRELPTKYRFVQEQVTEDVNDQLGLTLRPADVLLLAVGRPSMPPSDLERFLIRGGADEASVRVCLTPRMARRIDPALTPSVSARDYESLDP